MSFAFKTITNEEMINLAYDLYVRRRWNIDAR